MSVPVMTVSGENFSMDYVTFGSGPRTLVILPGMSLLPVTPNADAVAAAYASFAGTHTVYLFDRKRDVCPGYTVSDMADDTAAAMRSIGISDADVFGASQGGMIAQLIAARRPELVRRLVLLGRLHVSESRRRHAAVARPRRRGRPAGTEPRRLPVRLFGRIPHGVPRRVPRT